MAKSTEELLEDCKSDDSYRQRLAMVALQERGAREATPAILQLLSSPDEWVRYVAADALGHLGEDHLDVVGPALLRALDDPDEEVCHEAVRALGRLGYRPAIERLGKMLVKDSDWLARSDCADILADFGDPRAVDLLWPALKDEHFIVRRDAARALRLLGGPEILTRLTAAVAVEEAGENDFRVLTELQLARYRFGARDALDWLLSLATETYELGEDDYDVHKALTYPVDMMLSEGWRAPSSAGDVPAIQAALQVATKRWPDMQSTVDDLLVRLAERFPERSS